MRDTWAESKNQQLELRSSDRVWRSVLFLPRRTPLINQHSTEQPGISAYLRDHSSSCSQFFSCSHSVPMAPTPTDETRTAEPSSISAPKTGYWTKVNIAVTIVFGLLALGIFLALLVFYLHRRAERKKLENRKSDKAGLLANEDKTSMFSRQRGSSVTLYVDHNADAHNRQSTGDTMSLVPLHVTPSEETRDPIDNINVTDSTGSGVSARSRASNTNTVSTLLLSPVMGATTSTISDGDLGTRPSGRPRSVSSVSQKSRYYESTPTDIQRPPIPMIVRTPSDEEIRPQRSRYI